MEILEIRPSLFKNGLLFLASAAFTAGSAFVLSRAPNDWRGCLGAALFGLGTLVAFAQLVNREPVLRLDDRGIFHKRLPRGGLYWDEVSGFQTVSTLHGPPILTFNLTEEGFDRAFSGKRKSKWMKPLESAGFGPAGFPLSGLDISDKKLLEEIRLRCERFGLHESRSSHRRDG